MYRELYSIKISIYISGILSYTQKKRDNFMAVSKYVKFIPKLSKRELEVIETVLAGAFRYKSIASSLNISVNTVKTHLRKIYQTVGVNNIQDLATLFYGYSTNKTDITPKSPMKNKKSPQMGDSKQHFFAVIFYNIMYSGGKEMQNLKVIKIIPLFLVIALAVGFVSVKLVSGNRQNNTEAEIWSNVTNFNQLEGTWKQLHGLSFPVKESGGETWGSVLEDYKLVFNAADRTLAVSRKHTEIYTGGNIEIWELWKSMWEDTDESGYTIIFNEENHSIISVSQNIIQTLTDEDIAFIKNTIQINQNGTRLKETVDGVDIILSNIAL